MSHPLRRIANVMIAFVIAVFSVNLIGVAQIAAAAAPGNNGTLKVHEKGTPANSESNDPKVCIFNFEGFGLDPNQTGDITIDAIPPSTPASAVLVVSLSTDASGNGSTTPYINDLGGPALPNGHYKATLDNKFGTDPGDKAKSKVFKVECPEKTTVTATAPTFNDQCDIVTDSYTIPATTGVLYQINGITIPAGTYPAFGMVTINAVAEPNYVLAGTTQWAFLFTMTPCMPIFTPVTPLPATNVDVCGTASDTYTIPTTPGVIYLVNGVPTVAGTYPGSGNIAVTTMAMPFYVLTGTTSWNFNFTNVACPPTPVTPAAPTKVDVCGTSSDTYTIPATTGVTYKVNNVVKAAGTYPANGLLVSITATANPGYTLQGTKSWLFLFTNLACIVIPAEPTKVDVCGTANDTYTIPTTTGVRYFVNGFEKAAGTYTANGPVLIVAVAKSGYVLDVREQLIWLFTFSHKKCAEPCVPQLDLKALKFFHNDEDEEDCIPVATTPGVPSQSDVCGTGNDTYTIPSTAGVKYLVNGTEKLAGEYPATGTVNIVAVALPGYVLAGDVVSEWSFEFTNTACPSADLSVTAECSQTGVLVTIKNDGDGDGTAYVNGDAVQVPAGESVEVVVPYVLFKAEVVVYGQRENKLFDKDFDCTPGMGNVGFPDETPVPTVVTASATTELPTTGGVNVVAQIMTMIMLAAATYGATYYFWNRRNLTSDK